MLRPHARRTHEHPHNTQATSSGPPSSGLPSFDEGAEGTESRGGWTVAGMNGIVTRTLQKVIELHTLFENPLHSAHETSILVETWWEDGCETFDWPIENRTKQVSYQVGLQSTPMSPLYD